MTCGNMKNPLLANCALECVPPTWCLNWDWDKKLIRLFGTTAPYIKLIMGTLDPYKRTYLYAYTTPAVTPQLPQCARPYGIQIRAGFSHSPLTGGAIAPYDFDMSKQDTHTRNPTPPQSQLPLLGMSYLCAPLHKAVVTGSAWQHKQDGDELMRMANYF